MLGHLTYIVLELGWAAPVLALHWLVGARFLRPRLAQLAIATALPTVYLTAADGVALHDGIWSLHAARILGLRLGSIPIEEGIFFLVTNLLIAQTVILLVCSGLEKRPASGAPPRGAAAGRTGGAGEDLDRSLERAP